MYIYVYINKGFLEEMVRRHSIDEKTMASLLTKDCKPSRFYILPKIHKPGNPGRPIVSSCGSPTQGISHFVDYHLASLVQKIPSYIRDTADYLKKLQSIIDLSSETLFTKNSFIFEGEHYLQDTRDGYGDTYGPILR